MRYLAKGIVKEQSTEHILRINHFGNEFVLTGLRAGLWLDARLHIAETDGKDFNEEKELRQLRKMGLVEEIGPGPVDEYRALTHCVIVPAQHRGLSLPLAPVENNLLRWIAGAGLRLTMAELVYLVEYKIAPEAGWLGEENRQKLTELIYTTDTIFDNILETQMEAAECRDRTVQTVLSLLRKKRILLL